MFDLAVPPPAIIQPAPPALVRPDGSPLLAMPLLTVGTGRALLRRGATAPPVPIGAYAKLACNFDTGLTDISPSARTLTAHGNAAVSGGWLAMDGSGDWLDMSNSADFQFGSGAFGIECEVTIAAAPSAGNHYMMWWYGNDGNYYNGCWMGIDENRKAWGGIFDASAGNQITSAAAITLGVPTHIYFGRSGSTLYASVAGAVTTAAASVTIGVPSADPATNIGAVFGVANRAKYFAGSTRRWRIVKGLCPYTANFTPPAGTWVA
jgi:hypothetical protein